LCSQTKAHLITSQKQGIIVGKAKKIFYGRYMIDVLIVEEQM